MTLSVRRFDAEAVINVSAVPLTNRRRCAVASVNFPGVRILTFVHFRTQ